MNIKSIYAKIKFCWSQADDIKSRAYLLMMTTKLFVVSKIPAGPKRIASDQKATRICISGQAIYLRLQDLGVFYEIFYDEIYPTNFSSAQSPVIIDVGAHIGLATLYFYRNSGDRARYFCIEPYPPNHHILERNLQDIPAELFLIAISNHSGQLYLTDQGYGHNVHIAKDVQGYPTACRTMTAFVRQQGITQVELLKIDIEGAEQYIFEGDMDWIDICQNIIIECHSTEIKAEIEKILKNRNFACISRAGILSCQRKILG